MQGDDSLRNRLRTGSPRSVRPADVSAQSDLGRIDGDELVQLASLALDLRWSTGDEVFYGLLQLNRPAAAHLAMTTARPPPDVS